MRTIQLAAPRAFGRFAIFPFDLCGTRGRHNPSNPHCKWRATTGASPL
jgi:hypothetical protein